MPTFKRADQEQLEKAQDLLETSTQELGFAKSLFFGRLKLDEVLPYPKQDPDEARRTDELLAKVDAFMKQHVDADRIDAEERIPDSVIKGLGELGVLGMVVPKEYGGGGLSADEARVLADEVLRRLRLGLAARAAAEVVELDPAALVRGDDTGRAVTVEAPEDGPVRQRDEVRREAVSADV